MSDAKYCARCDGLGRMTARSAPCERCGGSGIESANPPQLNDVWQERHDAGLRAALHPPKGACDE